MIVEYKKEVANKAFIEICIVQQEKNGVDAVNASIKAFGVQVLERKGQTWILG